MRIACTSDWHGYIPPEIPDCDLLLFAGDLGLGERFSYEPEVLMTDWFKFLKELPMPVVAVAGNHDFRIEILRNMPWTYLQDEAVEIQGLKIWGSPWSNPFGFGWEFNMTEDDQRELFKQIPDDVDIIISHGPPYGFLDETTHYEVTQNVGSNALRERMDKLENLSLVVCGHIHSMYGVDEKVVNGSLVNDKYEITNSPIVFDL